MYYFFVKPSKVLFYQFYLIIGDGSILPSNNIIPHSILSLGGHSQSGLKRYYIINIFVSELGYRVLEVLVPTSLLNQNKK